MSNEEFDYLKRTREARPTNISELNDDGVSQQLLYVSEFEVSFNYISPFIEIIRKRLFTWSGKMLYLCEGYLYKSKKKQ